jgi:hypothetical protein
MTETPEARSARLLARSIAIDPPWDGTPACWAWPETLSAGAGPDTLSPTALVLIRQADGGTETLLPRPRPPRAGALLSRVVTLSTATACREVSAARKGLPTGSDLRGHRHHQKGCCN